MRLWKSVFWGALALSLNLFCESRLEGELAIAKESEKNLQELRSEIAWFIEERKEFMQKMAPIYQETGDLDALSQRNEKLFTELEALDEKFRAVEESLNRAIELAKGPAPHTALLQLCSSNALIASYRSLIEESLFPENWKREYEKSSAKKLDKGAIAK